MRQKMKRAAIIQTAYLPWKGFFDLIGRCEVYIIYNSAGFSKGHWHNRNKIKRGHGSPWLTIPVKTADRLGQPIDEVTVAEGWAERHWGIIAQSYAGSEYFNTESGELKQLFKSLAHEPLLTRINETFLRWFTQQLGLKTEILRDRAFSFFWSPYRAPRATLQSRGCDTLSLRTFSEGIPRCTADGGCRR